MGNSWILFVVFLIIYHIKKQQIAVALSRKRKKCCFYFLKRSRYTTFAVPNVFCKFYIMQTHPSAENYDFWHIVLQKAMDFAKFHYEKNIYRFWQVHTHLPFFTQTLKKILLQILLYRRRSKKENHKAAKSICGCFDFFGCCGILTMYKKK